MSTAWTTEDLTGNVVCPDCREEVRHRRGCPRIPATEGFDAGFAAGYRAALAAGPEPVPAAGLDAAVPARGSYPPKPVTPGTDHAHDPEQCAACRRQADLFFTSGVRAEQAKAAAERPDMDRLLNDYYVARHSKDERRKAETKAAILHAAQPVPEQEPAAEGTS